MSRRVLALLLEGATAVAIAVLDQYTKARWLASPEEPAGFWYLGGWIQSVAHQNYGITFNLPLPNALTLLITLIALLWVIRESRQALQRQSLSEAVFLGCIIGGALGNAYDRLVLHFVRDWLLLWFRSAINLADVSILMGALGYLHLRLRKKSQPTQ